MTALTNIACKRLDARLNGLATKLGFTYTRYADDLTFSSKKGDAPVGQLLGAVRGIVTEANFVIHPKKTRVMRRGRRQEVTGVVVNDKLGIDKKRLHRFRAFLHHLEIAVMHPVAFLHHLQFAALRFCIICDEQCCIICSAGC